MADSKRVANWLRKNEDTLNLRVTEVSSIQNFLPTYDDIKVEILINKKNYVGRGTAKNFDLSFAKAFSEACERATADYNQLRTSNGIAAHINKTACINNARQELVERHVFLIHFLTKTPFYQLSLALPDHIEDARRKIESLGIQIFFREATRVGELYTIVLVAVGTHFTPRFGCIFSSSTSPTMQDAIEQAFLQCTRNLCALIYPSKKLPSELLASEKIEKNGPIHNTSYAEQFAVDFFGKSNPMNRKLGHDPCNIRILLLPEELRSSPILVAQATSDKMQDLYFGPLTKAAANINAISSFLNEEIDFENLNHSPHPLS